MQPVSGKLVGYNRNPGLVKGYGRGWGGGGLRRCVDNVG